jgi:drug/metabolite transporter (DMT)-like permease
MSSAEHALHNRRGAGYAACALAGGLWSTGFLFGKIALRSMDSTHMVFYRFLFACVGFLPVLRVPHFSRKEWGQLLVASLLGVPVQFLTQFYGLSLTTVSHAALMVGTMPGILALGATIFAGERLPKIGWFALAGSSAGVALIVVGGSGSHGAGAHGAGSVPTLAGDMLIVLSLCISLGWILLNKSLLRKHSALQVTAWGLLTGTAMLAGWVYLRDWLIASGVLCTAATTLLWNWGMRHVPASRAAVFLNIEPALGSALGVWLLGDQLGPWAWAGGGLIVAAAVVLTSTGHADVELVLE